MAPHDVLDIALAAKQAGDQRRIDLAMMLLDRRLGRTRTPADQGEERQWVEQLIEEDDDATDLLIERALAD